MRARLRDRRFPATRSRRLQTCRERSGCAVPRFPQQGQMSCFTSRSDNLDQEPACPAKAVTSRFPMRPLRLNHFLHFYHRRRRGGTQRTGLFQILERLGGSDNGGCFCAAGNMGIDRCRTPVASKIAFPTAGARLTIGVSPDPAEGRSLRSTNTVSSTGESLNLGTR